MNLNISLFQFHKGTIKPQAVRSAVDKLQKFQFHKGTIKPYIARLSPCLTSISIP